MERLPYNEFSEQFTADFKNIDKEILELPMLEEVYRTKYPNGSISKSLAGTREPYPVAGDAGSE